MRYIKMSFMVCLALMCATAWTATARSAAVGETVWAAEAFRLMWQRTDQLVAAGGAGRGWYWGPQPRSQPLLERDDESPGGKRLVVYYDKGRMELQTQLAGAQNKAHLTFGRLVAEMVTGDLQLGARRIQAGPAARIAVAGDLDDPLSPTYATFGALTGPVLVAVGQRPGQSLDRVGTLSDRPELSSAYADTTYSRYDAATGHNIPRVFDRFMQERGTVTTANGPQVEQLIDGLAVVGHPMSEAYWADITMNGVLHPVLVQLFERRVLTYTPSNPTAFQVEMGNTGLHYYQWRYGGAQPRSARVERLLDHFERSDSATLEGNYWFSFDDRNDGGSSMASNSLISPGVFDSLHAMRFSYARTTVIPFSFASLSVNLGGDHAPADLRGTSALGFWARTTGSTRFTLQISSALADAPFQTAFVVPNGDWTWVEVPVAALQQDADKRTIGLDDALSSATRLSLRPATVGSGTLDIDDLVVIRGETVAPPATPGLPQVDDFEDGDLTTILGTNWFTYDDRADAGGSVAELAVVQPGANGSGSALRFRGTLDPQWAAVPYLGMGAPLAGNGATADLSAYSGLQLSVRTDGQQYRVQLNSKLIKNGNQYGLTLTAPNEWTTIVIPFKLLTPLDQAQKQPISWQLAATQLDSLIVTPLNKPPAFQLLIDDVHFVK